MNVKVFKDLGYAVSWEVYDYRVEYKVYEIYGIQSDGVVLYHTKASHTNNNITEDESEAVLYLEGQVKWDGCSNWSFDNEGIMLHFCDDKDFSKLGQIMLECWGMTKELIPETWLG